MSAPMLAGKRILVTGVLTKDSIAFGVAREALRHGAEILLTSHGRARSMTERSARQLAEAPPEVLQLDVTREEDFVQLREEIADRWGGLSGILHAIAHAPPDAIGAEFLATPVSSAVEAFEISAFSYKSLAHHLEPLMSPGGSIVGLDFDASRAWPEYDWMGVAKASLEAVNRYLARDLGPRGIRVNLIASGPVRSAASGGFSGFGATTEAWDRTAPLGWDARDTGPIAGAACFLFSEWSSAISGEIVHVDGGFHAMALAAG
ncbi:MAG TPA: enoyl-ACP reductase FabI [Solirubrobacterales bacterium]